jgi:hypothetical protein
MDNFPQGVSHYGFDELEEREEKEPEEFDTQDVGELDTNENENEERN